MMTPMRDSVLEHSVAGGHGRHRACAERFTTCSPCLVRRESGNNLAVVGSTHTFRLLVNQPLIVKRFDTA